MATKFLDYTGLSYLWGKIKAWCNATFAAITHNQASNTITAMTGYSRPSSASAISTSDTLNQAIGKLEKSIDDVDISNVVHRTGAESIAGVKTFTDILHATNSDADSSAIRIHCDVLDVASLPSSDKYANIHFLDVNGIQLGRLLLYKNANGQTGMTIAVKQHNSSSGQDDYDATLGVRVASDGSGLAYCPTPPNNSNTIAIATTEWVNSKGYITSSNSITGNAAGLSSESLGSDYEMTHTDFDNKGIGVWKASFKANTTSAPRFNDGDFAIMKLYNTTGTTYAQFLCMSPRRDIIYFGKFWEGTWQKWNEIFCSSQHIRLDGGNTIFRTVDTSALWLCGGTDINSNSYISVTGQSDSNAGKFYCVAKKGSTSRALVGIYNGNLTWNGQTIQTSSDARLKTSLTSVPDDVLDAWSGVDWGQFKFLSAIEEKGDSARRHVGLIAQQVLAAFDARGMDACDYGIACHDVWDDEYYEDTVTGEKTLINKAGETWMVRYTEALCMEAAYQRRKNKILENRISELERQVSDMLQILQSLKGAN